MALSLDCIVLFVCITSNVTEKPIWDVIHYNLYLLLELAHHKDHDAAPFLRNWVN